MYRVIDCITQDHQLWLVVLAGIVCTVGSCLSVLMTRRYLTTPRRDRSFRLALTGLMAGATVWSTHFIAMMGYDPGLEHGYDSVRTAASLLIAVAGTAIATAFCGVGSPRRAVLTAGPSFGLSVAAMHYYGISAYLLPGRIVWDSGLLVLSVLVGTGLSILAYQRIMYPLTRYCWLGGAVFMALAIGTTHFIGMAAITIERSPLTLAPEMLISDTTLALIISFVASTILLVGFAAFRIDTVAANQARKQTLHAATHDALTGLPNRTKLMEIVNLAAAGLEQDQTDNVALLFFNLNRFKAVNDLHGHATGDIALRTVASRVRDAVQGQEIIARTGGDEFVALKCHVQDRRAISEFAERLQQAIRQPIHAEGTTFCLSASIGIASSLDDGRDMEKLMQNSNVAMYRAKSEDGNLCFFDPVLDAQNRDDIQLASELRTAAPKGELELYFQRQNCVTTQKLTGFEVLLRWNHPARGLIMPGVFIPLAEKDGLIREIGLWVLREACMEAAQWPQPLGIAVNVAPNQLAAPTFFDSVVAVLKDSGLDAQRLELEITEESLVEDWDHTLSVMHKLRGMGVRIAMDDFGTGYSSLSMLQSFPFDKIKIDRSFIRDVHINPQRAAILRSTLILGEAFDIPVLAEGVETRNELDFINAAGCESAQGFYFGKPMNRASLHAVLNADVTTDDVERKAS